MVYHPCSFFVTAPVFDDYFHQITTRSINLEETSIQISSNACNKYTFSDIFSPDLTSTIHVHESNNNSLLPVAFFADFSSTTQFILKLRLPHTTKSFSTKTLPPVLPTNLKLQTRRKKHNTFRYLSPRLKKKKEEYVANVADVDHLIYTTSTFPISEE